MSEQKKRFRPNVAAVVMSSKYPLECKFLLGLRNDISGAWQFPQGGIDEGESPEDALLRELEEEIGTSEVEIIASHPEWISYEFPGKIATKMYPYDGQKQKYFLVKLKSDSKINIETKKPEFVDFKFVDSNKIFESVTYFKLNVYKKVIKYFKNEGYL
ncbi:MAG: RNA pyrophosphohydrolase [Proteobacteria bacterium]|nr:MAG: RNA pyrophosphohydrolase [Pseudomonadota bacterium]